MADALVGAGAVAAGALIGGPARFFLSQIIAKHAGEKFPWGTLAVNISGCFAMGVLASYAGAHGFSAQSPFWLLFATGLLGSYTTVSSFAFQTLALAHHGQRRTAMRYAVLSVALCISAVAAGYGLADLYA
ncbi:MAG: fluoride efflux transporter CrcB [Terricaulis silvestris]